MRDKQLTLEPFEQLTGNLLRLGLLRSGELRLGLCQQVKDCQLVLSETLANRPSLLGPHVADEALQGLKKSVCVDGGQVVIFHQLLKLLHEMTLVGFRSAISCTFRSA